MISKFKFIFLSVALTLTILVEGVYGQVEICNKELKDSFLNLKLKTDSDTLMQKHNFFTSQDYERINSLESFNDIIQVLKLLEFSPEMDSIKRIRIIECSFIIGAYSDWYITLQDLKNDYYFYQYQSNLGVKKIFPVGKLDNEDFIWKTAELLYGNRDGKSEDFMIMAEIENNSFSNFKSTQIFHFRDNTFLRMTMRLIDKSCD